PVPAEAPGNGRKVADERAIWLGQRRVQIIHGQHERELCRPELRFRNATLSWCEMIGEPAPETTVPEPAAQLPRKTTLDLRRKQRSPDCSERRQRGNTYAQG